MICGDGTIPYITRTDTTNGMDMFVGEQSAKYRVDEGNVITIGLDTQTVFYQPSPFYTGQNIQVVRHEKLDRYNAQFLIVAIKKLVNKFSWGSYGATLTRLRRGKIYLPVNENGEIDFQFMSDFMKQIETDILGTTLTVLKNRLKHNTLTDNTLRGGVILRKWKVFDFTEVFTEIQRGKRLKKADHEVGCTPYVSSTSFNNGVDGFVGNEGGVRKFENCLTLANSGSVGSAFYHRYTFVASDHVTQLKRDGLDKYAYLFMIPIINRLSEKYGFNREINDERIKREKMLLPVTPNGNIDFQYMSDYARTVEQEKLQTIIEHYSKSIYA